MDLILCPLCQHSTLGLVAKRSRMSVDSCDVCGLLWGRTDLSVAEASSGAIPTNPAHFDMLVDRDNEWRSIMSKMIDRRMSVFRDICGETPVNWLEIGPGNGGLAEILADRELTWQGVEIDRDMAARMRATGKNVVHADFAEFDMAKILPDHLKERGGFDLVFFSQVFEHVTAPAKFLKNVYDCLRPGGIVYVDVPNNGGLTAALRTYWPFALGYGEIVPPHHMIAYGANTLGFALRSAGFEKVQTFARAYDDRCFGLAHAHMETRLKMKAIWLASRIFAMGGNLVGLARRPILS